MNTKLREFLAEKCKKFGLGKKALDDLAEQGSQGLADDSSDEDIEEKADSLVPFAKAMQAEITRRVNREISARQSKREDGDDENQPADDMPEWAKGFKAQLDALTKENAQLKAEKAQSERQSAIAAKAKELGIPQFLMKNYAIADDADIEKTLTEFKQELVNNSLMPKEQVSATPNATVDEMKADAKKWAQGLPDLN